LSPSRVGALDVTTGTEKRLGDLAGQIESDMFDPPARSA